MIYEDLAQVTVPSCEALPPTGFTTSHTWHKLATIKLSSDGLLGDRNSNITLTKNM